MKGVEYPALGSAMFKGPIVIEGALEEYPRQVTVTFKARGITDNSVEKNETAVGNTPLRVKLDTTPCLRPALNLDPVKPFPPDESSQVKSRRIVSRQVTNRVGPIFFISHSESAVIRVLLLRLRRRIHNKTANSAREYASILLEISLGTES
ncbi:hypothetical protein Hamer_G013196 [Homarus americanus]|uniref:Uncharacterized protein n=1 Tax=Homarus americanus TaxID=6706 RepID=A0A8J5MV80_HOMAM|nr:hypothetical protein Hamer_G013196 [Homarus americanus]